MKFVIIKKLTFTLMPFRDVNHNFFFIKGNILENKRNELEEY